MDGLYAELVVMFAGALLALLFLLLLLAELIGAVDGMSHRTGPEHAA